MKNIEDIFLFRHTFLLTVSAFELFYKNRMELKMTKLIILLVLYPSTNALTCHSGIVFTKNGTENSNKMITEKKCKYNKSGNMCFAAKGSYVHKGTTCES